MPKPGMEAELDEVGGEPGLGRGDAEIGDQGQTQPGADSGALHGGDDRLLGREQPHRLFVERIDARHALAADAGGRGEVGAGAERLAGRHQHADAQRTIGVDVLQRIGQLAHQLDADEVVRRPAHFEQGHMSVDAGGDFAVLVFHRFDPRRLRATTHL